MEEAHAAFPLVSPEEQAWFKWECYSKTGPDDLKEHIHAQRLHMITTALHQVLQPFLGI